MSPEVRKLTDSEGRELLVIARAAIEHRITGRPEHRPVAEALTPALRAPGAAFVTLTKAGELRGCIGTLDFGRPLYQTVADCALSAALRDPRFDPVRAAEVPSLHVEVSVLTQPVPVSGPEDVVIGRDGLIVEKGMHRGLLLPQVAVEWGFDANGFLEATCEKAGLPRDAWRSARLERFEAQIFSE